MKTILIALTGLILASSTSTKVNAAEVKANRYVLANKAVAQSYTDIVVLGNVDVTLVQGTSNQVTMEGYQSQLENVSMEVKGHTLYINTKGKSKGRNPMVYVPVSQLEFLRVQGNSNVKTLGYLQSPGLLIELASECHVEVKTTGEIEISEISSVEYKLEKWVSTI